MSTITKATAIALQTVSNTQDVFDLPKPNVDLLKFTVPKDVVDPSVLTAAPVQRGLALVSYVLQNEVALRGFGYHFMPYEEVARKHLFVEGDAASQVSSIKSFLSTNALPKITFERDLTVQKDGKAVAVYAVYDRRTDEIVLSAQWVETGVALADVSEQLRFSVVFAVKILHELGHFFGYKVMCAGKDDLHSPEGVLGEEAGDSVEAFLFGGTILTYGTAQNRFEPVMLVIHVGAKRRHAKLVPIEWVQNLFTTSFWDGAKKLEDIQVPLLNLRNVAVASKYKLKGASTSLERLDDLLEQEMEEEEDEEEYESHEEGVLESQGSASTRKA